ncbi:alanine/glycine:cation symporter family protein [Peribacillus faecalis]|uniref:alanine/glycine:cation symporter family protein n=1 Tax=Peribacillus faecalis TaxID=2772559 RepID=UPI0019D7122E|nr:alanine/glycine:cation symporter family protein [Peribacillus faecalis]
MLDFLNGLNDIIWSYILIAVLLILGLLFSFKTKFIQFRYFGEMIRLLTDKAMVSSDGKKGLSSFQAFCISAASRVGTGNLAGVATAITLGGPGAVFWMWLIAFIGGASSFIESTLAQIYKVKDRDGFRGGPAYYMLKGLKSRWMGITFAITITLSFGLIFNSVQSNTIAMALENSFGLNTLTVGIILAVLTAIVIFGGVKRIAHVVQIIVPIMAVAYLILALVVMVTNITELPSVIAMIFKNAFGLEQAFGGGMGAAVLFGIKRGLFSNEAGMGSAPNAAATAAVTHPVKQGLIQTLGVFLDTILICSATAFIILLSDAASSGAEGINLTQMALSEHIGSWAGTFVSIAIFLFAFSSIIGNYYYGETNIEFIRDNKTILYVYRVAVIAMVIFGAVANLGVVWTLADIFMGVMALINLVAIFLLYKVVLVALKDYKEQRKQGKDPVFSRDVLEDASGVECWDEQ